MLSAVETQNNYRNLSLLTAKRSSPWTPENEGGHHPLLYIIQNRKQAAE
jgi:hypothetical protein